MAETKPRDVNRKAGGCPDCGKWVQPGEGFLYRHSGANLGRMRRNRYGKFTYVVRCKECGIKHDGPKGRASATASIESSGVFYAGYGGNSHAPCGN